MILPIYNAICDINPAVIQAAYDLGAKSKWQTFMKVLWPLSNLSCQNSSSIYSSLSLFMLTRLIGGNRVITLGTAIEEYLWPQWIGQWDRQLGLKVVLIVPNGNCYAIYFVWSSSKGDQAMKNKMVSDLFCFCPCFDVLPIFYLIYYSFSSGHNMIILKNLL